MTRAVLPPKFDALAPEVLADPYPAYARLRAAGPVCRVPPASFGITDHAHVSALLRDRRLGNDFPADNPAFTIAEGQAGQVFRRLIPTQDQAGHSRLHRLIVAAFSPRTARGQTDRIRAVAESCLAPATGTGRFDAAADLAFPVAVTVVCEMLGLPPDVPGTWSRAGALGKAFTPFLIGADRPAADEALAWLRGYVAEVLADRRRRPADDLVSRMLAEGDGLSEDEVVDNLAFLCFTGFETTMNMITTGCLALARFPDQMRRLRADRSLMTTAVEEFVRLDAPIQYTARVTREPITVGARTIRAGRSVLLMLGSANHDERVFTDPDRLDVGRSPNPHVGFGGGVRGCLGATLARIEGAAVFGVLVDGAGALAQDGPPRREPNALFRGYAAVPMLLDRP